MNIPRRRRYPMRPYDAGNALCLAYAVQPSSVNHTERVKLSDKKPPALIVQVPTFPDFAAAGRAVRDALRGAE